MTKAESGVCTPDVFDVGVGVATVVVRIARVGGAPKANG
jgi:hypothetical protein